MTRRPADPPRLVELAVEANGHYQASTTKAAVEAFLTGLAVLVPREPDVC
jgi:hypothetical protein